MSEPQRSRALLRLAGFFYGPSTRYGPVPGKMQEAELLALAATLDDATILTWRNTGPVILRWIRDHQPEITTAPTPPSVLGAVLERTGWRIEVFWNGSAGWFTARMVSLRNRDGKEAYAGGYLVPFDDPIGASGATPGEALANLSAVVLEWA